MDIKAFYKVVDFNLRKSGNLVFDKFKLDITDLISAVVNSDPAAVAESLTAWVNPNKPDGLERYALPIAVDNNLELIVGMLLYYKAKPDVRDKDGESALYKAVFWENENIVRLLIDKGASPTFPNADGKTPVQVAKESNYTNIHAILTNDKEQLKRMQLERDHATHIALKEKAHKAKAAKLNKALDKTEIQEEVLTIPVEQTKVDENKMLTKYSEFKTPFKSLLSAIKNQDTEAVKFFATKTENINSFIEGENPLQLAIETGKEKLALFLLDQGAKVFVQDETGNFPLLNSSVQHQFYGFLSVAFKKEDNAAAILNNKKQSFSAQFLAYKDPRMMDLLLQNGADPFFGGKDGMSPIIKAIEKGSIAILPVLSKQNVSFDRKIEDKSLMQWAVELKRADWVNGLMTEKALEKASQEDISAILDAAKATNDEQIINILRQL